MAGDEVDDDLGFSAQPFSAGRVPRLKCDAGQGVEEMPEGAACYRFYGSKSAFWCTWA